ncbi:hypothetical protein C0J52_20559 [Blattella germanica]|nr:hypothetical protein C0J52_20559 [Blattella germanica]
METRRIPNKKDNIAPSSASSLPGNLSTRHNSNTNSQIQPITSQYPVCAKPVYGISKVNLPSKSSLPVVTPSQEKFSKKKSESKPTSLLNFPPKQPNLANSPTKPASLLGSPPKQVISKPSSTKSMVNSFSQLNLQSKQKSGQSNDRTIVPSASASGTSQSARRAAVPKMSHGSQKTRGRKLPRVRYENGPDLCDLLYEESQVEYNDDPIAYLCDSLYEESQVEYNADPYYDMCDFLFDKYEYQW